MLIPQILVVGLFVYWGGLTGIATLLTLMLATQLIAMFILIKDPEKNTPFFNMTGVLIYIIGMMVSANGLFLMAG